MSGSRQHFFSNPNYFKSNRNQQTQKSYVYKQKIAPHPHSPASLQWCTEVLKSPQAQAATYQVGKAEIKLKSPSFGDKCQQGTTAIAGGQRCLHGLGALLEIAHPANGLGLLNQLAVTPMNHLVVCLPPAAVLCELVAWRKTLLLFSVLAELTQDLFENKMHVHCQRLQLELQVNRLQKGL